MGKYFARSSHASTEVKLRPSSARQDRRHRSVSRVLSLEGDWNDETRTTWVGEQDERVHRRQNWSNKERTVAYDQKTTQNGHFHEDTCKEVPQPMHIEKEQWTNSIDEEEDQGSSQENEAEGEKTEKLDRLETSDDEGEWCWPEGIESPDGESERIKGQHSTSLEKMTKKSRRVEDWFTGSNETAEGAQCTWKKIIVLIERACFLKFPQRKRRDPRLGRIS